MTRDGLAAVVRVRSVRELDSRIGLAHALSDQRAAEAAAEQMGAALASRGTPELTSAAAFVSQRHLLTGAATALLERERAAGVAAGVSAAARARWQDDRGALRAVELLAERRAEARRAELARREAAAADDIAAQRWARSQGAR